MNKKKNIIYIMVDEQRHDSFSFMGNPVVKTPNIDKLAKESAVFTNSYCASPLCVPSRVSMLTGQYVSRTQAIDNSQACHITNDQTSLTDLLKAEGYTIGIAGKNHVFSDEHMDKVFDFREQYSHWDKYYGDNITRDDLAVREFRSKDSREGFTKAPFGDHAVLGEGLHTKPEPFPETQCATHRIADDGIEFLRKYKDDPFFLYYSFPDPHWPNVVCEPYFSMYDPEIFPELECFPMDWSKHPFKMFVQSNACGYSDYTISERKRILATYYAQLSFIDKSVGRLIDELKAQGIYDDTIIVYASDHGNFAGRYGLIGKTGAFCDALVRVPTFIKSNNITPGERKAQINNIDISPTILDLLELVKPDTMQGHSFKNTLEDPKESHRDAIFTEVGRLEVPPDAVNRETYKEYNKRKTESDGWFWFCDYVSFGRAAMVKRDGWKYNFHTKDNEELYDTNTDPYELKNLAQDTEFEDKKAALRRELMEFMMTSSQSLVNDGFNQEFDPIHYK